MVIGKLACLWPVAAVTAESTSPGGCLSPKWVWGQDRLTDWQEPQDWQARGVLAGQAGAGPADRFHKTERSVCWLDGSGEKPPVLGNPLVSPASSVRHSATRPSKLLPSSCTLPRCCRYTTPRTPSRYHGSWPALAWWTDSPGHGPFLQDFLFFPQQAHLPCP